MTGRMKVFSGFFLLLLFASSGMAQGVVQGEIIEPQMQESQVSGGYQRAAPAIVKIVSDGGRKSGAGVILAIGDDGVGYVMTSYGTVAGLDKVAVILKNYPDALLGRIVEKWIDFDLDLVIVAIRNFPDGQPAITIQNSKSVDINKMFTLVAHTDTGDWLPIEVSLAEFDASYFGFSLAEQSGLGGAPILTKDGAMIGIVTTRYSANKEDVVSLAVKTRVITPIIDEWFKTVELTQKWQERKTGFSTWIWAVGGSIIGGAIVTAISISGGDSGSRIGLPTPPEPPSNPNR